MSDTQDPLETLWENLLSRERDRVRQAFSGLDQTEQQAVLLHLRKMSSEPGWHPEQRISAGAALEALEIGD